MSTTAEAVRQLTEPWEDTLSPRETGSGKYQTVHYDALLDMLEAAVRSSLGRTSSGPGSTSDRNVIDLKAFGMLENIDGITRAWVKDLAAPQSVTLKQSVSTLGAHLENLWAGGNIAESLYLNISRTIEKWVQDIWGLFNPPVKKELLADCPACGESEFITKSGERQTALIAQYWAGVAPSAECQRCPAEWVGEQELLALGYAISANVNEDELRQMGVL